MISNNEFSLLVAWKKHCYNDGVNHSLSRVMRALKRARLERQGQFPLSSAELLSPTLSVVRILNPGIYVVGACSPRDYICTILNRKTTEIVRPVESYPGLIYNFLCYGCFIVSAEGPGQITVFDLISNTSSKLTNPIVSIDHFSGYPELNPGKNMEIDKSVGYMLCAKDHSSPLNFLVRFNFRNIDPADILEKSASILKLQVLYEGKKIGGFCLSNKSIYIAHDKKIIVINKKSKKQAVYNSMKEGKLH